MSSVVTSAKIANYLWEKSHNGPMVELVDTTDLKSVFRKGVPVRVRVGLGQMLNYLHVV